MRVLAVCDAGVERHEVDELPDLLTREDAVIWVDIPDCDPRSTQVLDQIFGFHPVAVHDDGPARGRPGRRPGRGVGPAGAAGDARRGSGRWPTASGSSCTA